MTPAQTAACISQLPTDTLALVDKLFAPGLTREKLLSKILRAKVCDLYTTFSDNGWRDDRVPALTTHVKFEIEIPLGERFTFTEINGHGAIENVEPAPDGPGHQVTLKEGYLAKMDDTIYWSQPEYDSDPDSRQACVGTGVFVRS